MNKIEAKDLRVGNLVMYRSSEGDTPYVIDAYEIHECENYPNKFNLNHYPIPLTEEIVAENVLETIDLTLDKYIGLHVSPDGVYPILFSTAEVASEQNQSIGLERINYVHELQNLVWALFKKELEIKIETE